MELNKIKGINKTSILTLNKMNIYKVEDLLEYYPYRYQIYKINDINDVKEYNLDYHSVGRVAILNLKNNKKEDETVA